MSDASSKGRALKTIDVTLGERVQLSKSFTADGVLDVEKEGYDLTVYFAGGSLTLWLDASSTRADIISQANKFISRAQYLALAMLNEKLPQESN